MVLEDIKEGASEPTIPFVGEGNLGVELVTSLVVGFGLLALLKPLGENLGDMVSNMITQVTGFNPQTGEANANAPAFGGGL